MPKLDTLDGKLGQMIMVGFRGATPDECRAFLTRLRRYGIGGVWLTDNDTPLGRTHGNIRSPEQLKTLTAALQAAADVPLLIALDGEGGNVIRLKEKYGFPAFPSPQELGERDDTAFTKQQAARLAAVLRDAGVNFNFAPVVDLNRNPNNPVIGSRGRSFSADARVVARHAVAFIEAHHEAGLACAMKHFPGHGSSAADSHVGLVDVTATWADDELAPYREVVSRGLADAVLSAHIFLRQIDEDQPATLSPKIMTGLLRGRLGFDGVAISDDLQMAAVSVYYGAEAAIERAVHAGVDVLLYSNVAPYDEARVEKTIGLLRGLVEAGRIGGDRIDEALTRIMALKRRYGLV